MVKRAGKKTTAKKSAVKKTAAKASAAPKRAGRPHFLGVIHAAIAHEAARPILGRLSGDDLDVLAKHMSAGTLMSGLTPLADHKSKDDAIKAMPTDIGNIIAKLPDADVTRLQSHLGRLGRNKARTVVCGC